MPGIAIQSRLPVAGAPAARNALAADDDRFFHALHEKPKASAQADGKKNDTQNSSAADDSDSAHRTAPRNDKSHKVDQSAGAKDDRDGPADDEAKRDEDGNALPPHMKAERVFAQQWQTSASTAATKDGSSETDGTGIVKNSDATAQGANAGLTTGAAAAPGLTKTPAAVLDSTAPMSSVGAVKNVSAPVQSGEGNGPTAPSAGLIVPEPTPKGVSVVAASVTEAGNASAAFLTKIAALHHGAGSAPSPQQTGGAVSSPMPATSADAAQQISQALAGQGSGDAGANPDGSQGNGSSGAQNKLPQAVSSPTALSGDPTAAPLPTAQMVPTTGSAASFAGALAHNGTLARYAAQAAAALSAGTPANALPVQSLSIQLRPVELGSVTANLKYAGNGLTIDIEVETRDAQRRLSSDSSDIVKSLQSLGFQVDKVTVRQTLAQTQAQGQPQGQAMTRDGFTGQGGASFSMSGQSERQAGQHRQGTENRHEDGSERGIGMVRQMADHLPRHGVFI